MSIWDEIARKRRAYENNRDEALARAKELVARTAYKRRTVHVWQDELGWWRVALGVGASAVTFRARSVDELLEQISKPAAQKLEVKS